MKKIILEGSKGENDKKKRRKNWISLYGRKVLTKRDANEDFDDKFRPLYGISLRQDAHGDHIPRTLDRGLHLALDDRKFAWCSSEKKT